MKSSLVIATRESPLALYQAQWVKQKLLTYYPDLDVQFLGITTAADKFLTQSLGDLGGKGVFVKELEEALLQGRADLAVHSMKDVPMHLPNGLAMAAVCEREDARDVFVSKNEQSISQLPPNTSVGTSSLRRQSQLKARYPLLRFESIRGNLQTRLSRLTQGEFAGLVLAAAGLHRMGLEKVITHYFSIDECLPAAGQGALGIECRLEDKELWQMLAPLNHLPTAACVESERALCRILDGGCQVPLAAYAVMHGEKITLRGLVGNSEGTVVVEAKAEGLWQEAESVGHRVAKELLAKGAHEILEAYRHG